MEARPFSEMWMDSDESSLISVRISPKVYCYCLVGSFKRGEYDFLGDFLTANFFCAHIRQNRFNICVASFDGASDYVFLGIELGQGI